jgi:hypothetical protein
VKRLILIVFLFATPVFADDWSNNPYQQENDYVNQPEIYDPYRQNLPPAIQQLEQELADDFDHMMEHKLQDDLNSPKGGLFGN